MNTNETAEKAANGAAIHSPKAAITAFINAGMKSDMFSNSFLGAVFDESLKMYSAHGTVDAVRLMTLQSEAYNEEDTKLLIADCIQEFVGIHNLPVHIKAIKNCYKARELSKICSTLAFGADSEIIDEQLQEVGERVSELLRNDEKRGLKKLGDVIVEQYSRLFDKGSLDSLIKTGFSVFDRIVKGIAKKNLVIIAARPGVGKSAISLHIANYNALRGKKVALFSLEMGIEEISERLIANTAPVNLSVLQDRDFGDHTGANISQACGKLKELPFYFDDSGFQTVQTIRAAVQIHKIDLCIVDYLQLISPSGRTTDNRNNEIAKITRELKQMAQDLDIPVIALSQLNRSKDETDEPSLRDLRDSGAIEQDANMVWLMWLNGDQKDQSVKQVALRAAKNRQGMTGEVVLNYRGALMQFEETDLPITRTARKSAAMPWEEVPDRGVF